MPLSLKDDITLETDMTCLSLRITEGKVENWLRFQGCKMHDADLQTIKTQFPLFKTKKCVLHYYDLVPFLSRFVAQCTNFVVHVEANVPKGVSRSVIFENHICCAVFSSRSYSSVRDFLTCFPPRLILLNLHPLLTSRNIPRNSGNGSI